MMCEGKVAIVGYDNFICAVFVAFMRNPQYHIDRILGIVDTKISTYCISTGKVYFTIFYTIEISYCKIENPK